MNPLNIVCSLILFLILIFASGGCVPTGSSGDDATPDTETETETETETINVNLQSPCKEAKVDPL